MDSLSSPARLQDLALDVLPQRTLAGPVSCAGIGVHEARKARVRLVPAAADAGIVFVRTDITDRDNVIPASYANVHETRLRTELRNGAGVTLSTIEHLMSALADAEIDNLRIEVDGPEIPILDGSAAPFALMIDMAGVTEQDAPRTAIVVRRVVEVRRGDAVARLAPQDFPSFHLSIAFGDHAGLRQSCDFTPGRDDFRNEIAPARTFGFLHELDMLHRAGLALGASYDNSLVYDAAGRVISPGGERMPHEAARHKILDARGDLYLAGKPIIGRFTAERTGHGLNRDLLSALLSDPLNYDVALMRRAIPAGVLAAQAERIAPALQAS